MSDISASEAAITSRLVNALFTGDRDLRALGTFSDPRVPMGPLTRAQSKRGGIWVGGEVRLYPGRLVFEASALNKRLHGDAFDTTLILDAPPQIHVRLGILTRLITVSTLSGALAFRCWRAGAFAKAIRATVII